SPPICRAAIRMVVPGSTSTVMLSMVTLNNFGASDIPQFIYYYLVIFLILILILTSISISTLTLILTSKRAPPPPADPHNAPVHNFFWCIHRDSAHAIQIRRGNGGSPRPPARLPHHPTDKLYFLLSFAVYPITSR